MTLSIGSSELASCRVDFPAGHTVFTEGDDSRDMYILLSGSLEVLKGSQQIATIETEGALFGEMSFFLETSRTSTVRTKTDVTAYRIPRTAVAELFGRIPDLAMQCIRILAERLAQTSRLAYGLKELCDQIPEAVLITDSTGGLLSWNSAAEQLYGSSLVRGARAERLVADPEAYLTYLQEVQEHRTVRERVFALPAKEGRMRFVSVTATLLYDGHHQVQGVLSLSHDATPQIRFEQRYRRIRRWLVVPLLAAVMLGAALLYTYPYFIRGRQAGVVLHRELQGRISRDYKMLQSMLASPLAQHNVQEAVQRLQDFFALQQSGANLYKGVVLLDGEKKVIASYSHRGTPAGGSYAGIGFHEISGSQHRVVTVYRPDPDHPMGEAQTEVVFSVDLPQSSAAWLVLQMDMHALRSEYHADALTLQNFRFQR